MSKSKRNSKGQYLDLGDFKFMLVRNGFIANVTLLAHGKLRRMLPLFTTYDDAKQFKVLVVTTDRSIARIGSLEGETVAGCVKAALDDGCEGIVTVKWVEGKPELYYYI